MLNSYEIATQLKNKLHIKSTYTLKDVLYHPYSLTYRIFIEDFKENELVFDIDSSYFDACVEAIGMNSQFKLLEDEINDELRDVELDSLVEYYFKKGMHMAEINKKLMTGGLNYER